jgi:hypothetical protein
MTRDDESKELDEERRVFIDPILADIALKIAANYQGDRVLDSEFENGNDHEEEDGGSDECDENGPDGDPDEFSEEMGDFGPDHDDNDAPDDMGGFVPSYEESDSVDDMGGFVPSYEESDAVDDMGGFVPEYGPEDAKEDVSEEAPEEYENVGEQSTVLVGEITGEEMADESNPRDDDEAGSETDDAGADQVVNQDSPSEEGSEHKFLTDPEEFEYLWEKYETYEQEGKSSEEISALMREEEVTYERLKEVERQQEREEKERLKRVDHADEEEPEDYKREIDRPNEIEHFVNAEEGLIAEGKSPEEVTALLHEEEAKWDLREYVHENVDKERKEHARIVEQQLEELEDVKADEEETNQSDSKAASREGPQNDEESENVSNAQDQEGIEDQEAMNDYEARSNHDFASPSTDGAEDEGGGGDGTFLEEGTRDASEIGANNDHSEGEDDDQTIGSDSGEARFESNAKVESPRAEPYCIEIDALEVIREVTEESDDQIKTLEGDELSEEEKMKMRERYRRETGKRPLNAGKQTVGFMRWLEQRPSRGGEAKAREKEEPAEKEEGWQRTLREWMERAKEGEISPGLKRVIMDILRNFALCERLEELFKKQEQGELTKVEQGELRSLKTRVSPIHYRLYFNVSGFKTYYEEQHWWKPALIEALKNDFLDHLTRKYRQLCSNLSKAIEQVAQLNGAAPLDSLSNSFQGNVIEKMKNVLKGYMSKRAEIIKHHQGEIIFERLLEYSESIVRDIINEYETARAELKPQNKADKVQTKITNFIDGTTSQKISIGDANFAKVLANPIKYGFKYYVYKWEWKSSKSIIFSFEGVSVSMEKLPYVGFTENFERRMEEEIFDPLRHYSEGRLTRPHEKVVIAILNCHIYEIVDEIHKIDKSVTFDQHTSDLEDVYFWIKSHYGRGKRILKFILEDIIKDYYEIYISEIHDNALSALKSEKKLSLEWHHNGLEGTVWPNGLNKVSGGIGLKTGAKEFVISHILDVIALTSLGLLEVSIAELLTKTYKLKVNHEVIYQVILGTEFKSFDGLQNAILKPIVWKMITDSAMFTIDQLRGVFPFDYLYLDTRLNKWFGHSLLKLRQLIRAGCLDWHAIDSFTEEQIKVFRGKSPSKIKEILLKSKRPTVELSKAIGLSKVYTSIMYKISQFFIGQDMFAQDLQRNLRMNEAITLLKGGVIPHVILNSHFNLQIWKTKGGKTYLDKTKLRYYYEQYLFRDTGLTFEKIVKKYYNNIENILDLYKDGNIILKGV